MAEEKILYRIVVDGQNATAKIIDLTNGVEKADVAVENLNQTLGEMNGEMVRTTSGIGRQMASLKKQRSQVQINSKEYQNLTKSMRFYQSQMDMSTGATGSASSAAMELGRVLSDAPYGIRGVANNVSQFASQMAFAAKSTGSLTLAFKDLWKALMGPLGILLAIQGVIALLDFYKGGMSKSKDETVDAEKATKDFSSELKSLEKTLSDSGVSQENYNQKIRDYILLKKQQIALDKELLSTQSDIDKKNEEINASIEDDIKLNERLEKARKDAAEQAAIIYPDTRIGREAKAQAVDYSVTIEEIESRLRNNISHRKKLEEDIVQLHADALKKIKEIDEAKNKLGAAEEGTLKALKDQRKELEKTRELEAKTPEEYKKQSIAIDKITKQIEYIEGVKKDGGRKLSIFDTPEELEIKVKDTLNARQKLAQKTEMINLKTEEKARLSMVQNEEDKTFIKEEYALRRLEITEKYEKKAMLLKKQNAIKSAQETHAEYSKKVDKDLAKFISGIKKEGRALTDAEQKEITRAETVAFDKKKVSGDRLTAAVTQIEDEYKKLFPFWEQMAAARKLAIGQEKPIGEAEEFTLQDGLQEYMKLQSSMTSFLSAEYDRQLTIEQNKTNALNNELNQRLLNEDLSKDERERIQLQIGRNDEKLRKKQEAIEKKRFKLNKAANIANATINTYLGASQVIGDETIPSLAKPFVVAATIASGLLQVAAIARQKFQSSAGSGGSIGAAAGGNGEGESREFNFNLAGSTQSNQLTQSIASQLSQPIQTYVVSSEVTSQQQLDLNISNTATIG